jgi:hypothetical protein
VGDDAIPITLAGYRKFGKLTGVVREPLFIFGIQKNEFKRF